MEGVLIRRLFLLLGRTTKNKNTIMAIIGGKPAPEPPIKNGLGNPQDINMIGQGAVFEGSITTTSDIRISGRVEGKVEVQGKVFISADGVVDGELSATNADIAGAVNGRLTVTERLVVRSSAQIDAEMSASRLIMEEGAVFTGKVEMGQVSKLKSRSGNGAAVPVNDKL